MAKVICLVLGVFIAAVAIHSSPLSDEIHNGKVQCLKEFDLTDQGVSQLVNSTNPADSRKLLCFKACFMKKMGLMVDGKINLKRVFIDDDVLRNERTLFQQCKEKAEELTDECEIADSFYVCMNAIRPQNEK